MKSFNGLSLVESLITLMILSLLSGILIWMILLAKTTMESSKNRTYLRQEMQMITADMVRELQDSTVDSITSTMSNGIKALSFLSARNTPGQFVTDTGGFPLWQNTDSTWRFIIYYIPENRTVLIKKEVARITGDPLPSVELLSYCDGRGEHVSSMVSDLSLTLPLKGKYIDLSLTFQSKSNTGKTDLMSFQSRIFISN